jgi:hypothetical protein
VTFQSAHTRTPDLLYIAIVRALRCEGHWVMSAWAAGGMVRDQIGDIDEVTAYAARHLLDDGLLVADLLVVLRGILT